MSYDLLIANGTVVDGTGDPPRRADVAVQGGRIVAVGRDLGRARRTIDAEGQIVTPGFVDIHTHLDAQIWWDPTGSSACWHGVTSVVMGNCGVGFAPCRPKDREYLARLMESVEDIPAESILEGLPWAWESYGQYLGALADRGALGVNVGGLVGHCALRLWAMGKRGLDQKHAGRDDIDRMREGVREALRGGALGFSTSRTLLHRTPEGEPVPGTFADFDELLGIARVLQEEDRGVFEAVPYLDSEDPEVHASELRWMAEICRETGRPLTFGLIQMPALPDAWRDVLHGVDAAVRNGARLRPQTQVRSVGVLFSVVNLTPWDLAGGTWGLLKLIPLEERLAAFRDPDKRAKLIADSEASPFKDFHHYYLLREENGNTRYDARPEDSLTALAARRGTTPVEAFMDLALETRGEATFIFPFANFDLEVVREMLRHPQMLLGLADTGAHCGQIMDASLPTYLLSYWVGERQLFALEEAIRKLTSEPAEFFGLGGRGVIREGAHADLNVIEIEALRVRAPEYVRDFPAGASRYVQRAEGYRHTIVNGQPFMQNGEHTGAHAGQVL
ncbi:MAG: amidohydrolase family protein [Myxococcota bacterium]